MSERQTAVARYDVAAVGTSPWRQVATLVAVAVPVAVLVVLASDRHGFFDLKVYYGAINSWLVEGMPLYSYIRPHTDYGFTYPPFAALVMSPMAVVPWMVAIVLTVTATLSAASLIIFWLVEPIARRRNWTLWFTMILAVVVVAAFEPVRETVTFGQVNLLLVALVFVDVRLLLMPGRRWAGVGIGLATAIKLTPGIFILYLLVTRRWRAAAVAAGTASIVTAVAAAISPPTSWTYWTVALLDTDRVGSLSFVSNQSIQGFVARLNPDRPSAELWLTLVLAVLVFWAVRVRAMVAAGDEIGAFALTGVVGCLVSPVTWIHHLVWVLPAFILLVDRALDAPTRRRRGLLTLAALGYAVMCSRLVWVFEHNVQAWGGVWGGSAYLWICLALLAVLPVRAVDPTQGGHLIDVGSRATGSRRSAKAASADAESTGNRTAALDSREAGDALSIRDGVGVSALARPALVAVATGPVVSVLPDTTTRLAVDGTSDTHDRTGAKDRAGRTGVH